MLSAKQKQQEVYSNCRLRYRAEQLAAGGGVYGEWYTETVGAVVRW